MFRNKKIKGHFLMQWSHKIWKKFKKQPVLRNSSKWVRWHILKLTSVLNQSILRNTLNQSDRKQNPNPYLSPPVSPLTQRRTSPQPQTIPPPQPPAKQIPHNNKTDQLKMLRIRCQSYLICQSWINNKHACIVYAIYRCIHALL